MDGCYAVGPKAYHIARVCGVKGCVNPKHLEIVLGRKPRGDKDPDFCFKGHVMAGKNLAISRKGDKRWCRKCHNEASKLRMRRIRGTA